MKRVTTILKKELKDTIRDRRTLVVMVLLPVLMMPLLTLGSVKLQERASRSAEEDVVQLMITGSGNAPDFVSFIAEDDKIEITGKGNPADLLKEGEIDAHLIIPDDFNELVEAEGQIDLVLQVNSTKDRASPSVDKIMIAVGGYNKELINERLGDIGVNTSILREVGIITEDTATRKEKGGTFLGYLLPMFLSLFAILGGMYTAMDISAGEKERNTLEALLMTPASRLEIVTGKFLTVATVAIVTVVLAVGSVFITAQFMTGSLGDVEITIEAKAAAIMIPVAVLLASMFAAVLLAVSIFAKSYKEAQNYVTPIYLLAVFPIIVANVIGSDVTTALFIIPGFNAVILFRELLVGDYVAAHIIVTAVSIIACTAVAIWYAVRIYSREDVLLDEERRQKKLFR